MPSQEMTLLSDFDLHLFNEGRHYRLYEKLGAHPVKVAGVSGTYFAVWAPNANYVSVIGDFNGWNTAAIRSIRARNRESGKASSPASARARSTSSTSARTTAAIAWTRWTRSASTACLRPRPGR